MFVGLLVGLAVSLGIAFYLNPRRSLHDGQAQAGGEERRRGKPPAIAGLPQGGAGAARDRPRSRSSTSTGSCPGRREPVTEKELRERLRAAGGSQQEAAKDVYFIQAGSFQNPADADNQKARLAILGFESSVEPANLPDKGTWYRVRLGPYNKLDEINRVRQALAQNDIDASLVKIKEQP